MKVYTSRRSSLMHLRPESSPLQVDIRQVQDGRDGSLYDIIRLNKGGLWWLADNLRYEPEGLEGAWPCSEDPGQVAALGCHYNFHAAGQAAAGFGSGWRLPADEDWQQLLKALGGYFDKAANRMIGPDPDRTRQFLLHDPVGQTLRMHMGGRHDYLSDRPTGFWQGNFWSSTTQGAKAWCYSFYNSHPVARRRQGYLKHGYSVRLVCG